MSVPPVRRLPERPSLEQLRKQAKEHLETMRAGGEPATLSAAQHALAREYGFESWPKLVHHVLPDVSRQVFFKVGTNRPQSGNQYDGDYRKF